MTIPLLSCLMTTPGIFTHSSDESLLNLYHNRVHIRLIDAQSPKGLWKQIRHWIFTYPAWIIDNRAAYAGWDSHELS
jgi:hypothetical protein